MPNALLEEVKRLENELTVDTATLKKITNHFVTELAKGLTVEGGSIVSPFLVASHWHPLQAN